MNQYTVKVTGLPNTTVCKASKCTATVTPAGLVQINVTTFGASFGFIEGWLNSLEVCDSDNAESQTGNSAEEAGVEIGGWYLKAENHVEGGGGSPKKRFV